MMLMDQHAHIQKRMSNQRSVTTDPNMKPTGSDTFFWDDPRKVGVEVTQTDGSKYFRGPGAGTAVYLTHLRAKSRDFIKGEMPSFSLPWRPIPPTTQQPVTTTQQPVTTTQQPVTTTQQPVTTTQQPNTTAPSDVCLNVQCLNEGVCVVAEGKAACRCVVGDDWWYYGNSCQHKGSTSDKTTLALASSLSVLGVMLVVTAVSVICLKKKYKKRSNGNCVVMENMGAN
ncbi:hypothetical protein F7725_011398 [Dissostichus mawsoni]|uniref:EGF-like domain-containing protein n=1 Tax=Dissostichus mawsoni TaxID=36200 RepID=A0A7J5ZBZ5_DISMA|nr:hypothetical protein F7725_011398 [Dissostichus mawsoni]